MAQNGDNGGTERRKGLHELAHQIECIRVKFEETHDNIDERLIDLEMWRKVAHPVVQLMVRTMWIVSGASVVLAGATAIVLWTWLQDHSQLGDVSKLLVQNNIQIQEIRRDVDRIDQHQFNRKD
jgi:hypothetical protein